MNRKQIIKELIRAYKYVQIYRKENKTLHMFHWLKRCEKYLQQLQIGLDNLKIKSDNKTYSNFE